MLVNIENYLKSKIQEYYNNNFITIDNIEKREIGYGIYNRKIANRNISFKDNYDLNTFLRTKVPFYLSYSMAQYEYPDKTPTIEKKIIKSDFLLEYDADDIPTPCKKIHDSWYCDKCNESGQGNIRRCPKCNSQTKISEWICDKCLEATKKQTIKLYNILTHEFNFEDNEIKFTFSGHKGYHTKIVSEKIAYLKKSERLDLLDYFIEENLNFKEIGFVSNKKGSIDFNGKNIGKSQKYLNYLKSIIENSNEETLLNYFDGLASKTVINKILKNKQEILQLLEKNKLYKLKSESEELWYALLEKIKDLQKLYIDKQTSIDMHKIIRCPETIHGGAMLISKSLTFEELNTFQPFSDAKLPLKEETLKIHLKKVPRLLLNRIQYGPYNDEIVELPITIALYFLARGAADEIII